MVTRSSTLSGSKFVRFVVTVFPEVENTLSLFALHVLAGMARIALATEERMGKPSL